MPLSRTALDARYPHKNVDIGRFEFAADYSYGAAESVIGHYSLADDVAQVTTLPHGGTFSFVVLPSSEAGTLVP